MPLLQRTLIGAALCVIIAPCPSFAGEISLLAGADGDSAALDGAVAIARFKGPLGIAVDRTGNVFVTDGHAIRKFSAAGEVTTLAGRASEWGSADGGVAAARFNNPRGLAVDGAGNVYVADRDNQTIRKITPAGRVSTLAGAAGLTGSVDGQGAAARFFRPSAVAVDATGNVFVADTRNFTLRKISPVGLVTTIAGRAREGEQSKPGYADGPASAARFGFIEGIAVDAGDNVYVADNTTHVIRKLGRGVVSTIAGQAGAAGSTDGVGSAARFSYPIGIAADADGNLFVADSHAGILRRISTSGVVTTLAGFADHQGNADGLGSAARFNALHGIALDADRNLWVTDFVTLPPEDSRSTYYQPPGPSGTIRRIDAAGLVTTVAGRGSEPEGSIDGSAKMARFEEATGIAAGKGGAVYVTDVKAGTIRRISAAGEIATFAGKAGVHEHKDGSLVDARFNQPTGIAIDRLGTVYVTDAVDAVVRRISADGVVTTWAGTVGAKATLDGKGAAARFHSPNGIAIDQHGTVFVSDGWDGVIRRITPAGDVTTYAGKSGQRGSADGPIQMARFNTPEGLAVDAAGNLYVCDYGNRTIRRITPQGRVSTVAGSAQPMGKENMRPVRDGAGTAARFDSPLAIASDELGNLFVVDAYTIRRITLAGVVTTIAGEPDQRGIKLGKTPGRLESAGGVAVIDANTIAVTQGRAVVKIVLNASAAAH